MFSNKLAGIDIGTENIKIVQLKKKQGKWLIDEFLKVQNPLRQTNILDINGSKAFVECLKYIKNRLSFKKCVVGIPSNYLFFRNLKLPKLNEKELSQAVYWSAQELKPMFKEEITYDFELLEENPEYCRVILVAAEKAHVLSFLKAFEEAGLYVKAFDVYPLAVHQFFKLINKNYNIAVIDLGFSTCDITIMQKNTLFSNRSISIGGKDITINIAKMLNISEAEAENIKRQGPKKNKEDVKEKILLCLQELITEILRFFQFFSIQSKEKLDYILLTGSESRIWYLKEAFQDYFQTQVAAIDEFNIDLIENPNTDIKYFEYLNAIGFAFRGLDGAQIKSYS